MKLPFPLISLTFLAACGPSMPASDAGQGGGEASGGSSAGGGSAVGGGSTSGGGSAVGGGSTSGGGSAIGGGSDVGGGTTVGGGSATGGGDAGMPDAGEVIHATAPINLKFDDEILTSLHVGDAWFVGGDFERAEVTVAHNAIGLALDGNVAGCNPLQGFDGAIMTITHIGDSIYVGGAFTHYRGQLANRLAKIYTATCALDTVFSPATANGFDDEVHSIAPTADGASVIVGGNFRAYRALAQSQSPWYLTKLDATTGDIVQAFHTTLGNLLVDGRVDTLVVDGTALWVGGTFTRCASVDYSCINFAKLNLTTGVADATFSPVGSSTQPFANGFNSMVSAIAVTPTHVIVGGVFDSYRQGASGTSPYNANHIAKLDKTTGALVPTFGSPGVGINGFNFNVLGLKVDGNALYVGGDFNGYRGVADSANHLAKIDLTTGALDTTFGPPGAMANGFDAAAHAFHISGNSLYVGGDFEWYRGVPYVAPGIAKLDKNTGVLDTTFHPTGDNAPGVTSGPGQRGFISDLHLVGTTLWAVGQFDFYGGKSANHLAKFIDATGAFDTTFSPPGVNGNGFDNSVNALVTDGTSLYVGGSFNRYKRVLYSSFSIAKLSLTTGAIDTTFSPVGSLTNGFDGDVRALAIDGNTLWVGGDFTQYRNAPDSANGLAKLSLTGTLDTTFSPPGAMANGVNGSVTTIAVTPTAIYAGGNFNTARALPNGSANRVARFDKVTGLLDTTFSPAGTNANGTDGNVLSLAIADDALFIGGRFASYRGAMYSHFVKVDLLTGAPVSSFVAPGPANGFDSDVAVMLPVGNALYVGGWFSAYRGAPASASYMAKLNPVTGALDSMFTPTGAPRPDDFGILSMSAYGSKLLVGGYLAYCDNAQCVSYGLRVNQATRAAE